MSGEDDSHRRSPDPLLSEEDRQRRRQVSPYVEPDRMPTTRELAARAARPATGLPDLSPPAARRASPPNATKKKARRALVSAEEDRRIDAILGSLEQRFGSADFSPTVRALFRILTVLKSRLDARPQLPPEQLEPKPSRNKPREVEAHEKALARFLFDLLMEEAESRVNRSD